MIKEERVEPEENQETEIDLIELGLKLWGDRRRVVKWAVVGLVIGIIIAISIPREYMATVTLVPESGSSRGASSLGALAALAGVNVGGGGGSGRDAVYPGLYPDVVSSIPFALELSDVELPTGIKDEPELTLKEILYNHTSRPWWSVVTGLPGRIMGMFESKTPDPVQPNAMVGAESEANEVMEFIQPNSLRLTKSQMGLVGMINSCVNASVDSKTQIISINVTMQDALAAACLADTVATRLQEFVTAYRTNKARHDLAFAKQVNEEAQNAYYEAQKAYAKAMDRNQGIALRSAAIELERLQNEAALAYNLYNSTSQQVQVAEVKVQENTPVFTVMQPAVVPFKSAKPNVMMIMVAFTFLGAFAALAYSLVASPLMAAVKEKKQSLEKQENK